MQPLTYVLQKITLHSHQTLPSSSAPVKPTCQTQKHCPMQYFSFKSVQSGNFPTFPFLPKAISKLFTTFTSSSPYLWGLVVHRKNSNIEADSIQSATMLIADRKYKLDLLRIGPNVLQWGHVSNLHIVHSVLQKVKRCSRKRRRWV